MIHENTPQVAESQSSIQSGLLSFLPGNLNSPPTRPLKIHKHLAHMSLPGLLPETPGGFLISDLSLDARINLLNHSSFSRPVLPKRYNIWSRWPDLVPSWGWGGFLGSSLPRSLSAGSFSSEVSLSVWALDIKSSCRPSSMQMGYFLFQIRFRAKLLGTR